MPLRIDPAIPSAWERVAQLWRPMAGWTLLVWAVVAVILAPLASAVFGWHVLRAERFVFANEDIFSPLGVLFLVVAASVTLTGTVVRYAGLNHILREHYEGQRPSVRLTALRLAPLVPRLYRLAAVTVGGALLLVLPLLGALGLVYILLLGAHDINYYLAARPAEWRWAVALGGMLAALWAVAAAYVAGRAVLAVPAYLDGYRTLRGSVRRAWTMARGRTVRLFRLLGLTVGSWLALRFLVDATWLWLAATLVDWVAAVSPALRPVALTSGFVAAVAVALDATISFLGFAVIATVITKFYYEDTGLHDEAPPAPSLRTLPGRARARVGTWFRGRRLVPTLAVLLLTSVGVSLLVLAALPEPRPVAVHAHRAGPPPAPENTLAALERAIEGGADYSEIDVQRTRDGVLVIVHDADYMRVAGDPRRVADTDWADLADLVQRPDDGSPPEERRVATLDEFLERARGRIGLNIELKYYGWDAELAPEVVRTVRTHGAEGEVLLMSLSLPAVRQLRRLAPDVPVGYVSAAALGDLTRLPVDFLALSGPAAPPRVLRAARQRGVEVHVWTINDRRTMAEMIERGVDGIITDDPALAVRVRDELEALTVPERLLLRMR